MDTLRKCTTVHNHKCISTPCLGPCKYIPSVGTGGLWYRRQREAHATGGVNDRLHGLAAGARCLAVELPFFLLSCFALHSTTYIIVASADAWLDCAVLQSLVVVSLLLVRFCELTLVQVYND